MNRILRQFNWRFLLVRFLVNAIAVAITAAVTPKIYFVDKSVWSWLLITVMLGVLNALLKPILQFLTLRFIFVTYGLVIVLVNTLILLGLSFLFPARFAVENLWWALVGGLVLGLLSSFLESLLGLTMPIVPEEETALRRQLAEEARATSWRVIARRQTVSEEQALAIEPSHPDIRAAEAAAAKDAAAKNAVAEDTVAEAAVAEPAPAEPAPAEPAPAEPAVVEATARESAALEPPPSVADEDPSAPESIEAESADSGASPDPEPAPDPGEESTEEDHS